MSTDTPSGGDRRPDQPGPPERGPFPGQPADRPRVPPPAGTKTAEEMRAERAKYTTTSEYNAAAAAEKAARQPGGGTVGAPQKDATAPGPGLRGTPAPGTRGRTGTAPDRVPARGDPPGQQSAGMQDRSRPPRPDVPGARGPDGLVRPDRHRLADYRAFPGRPADRPPVPPPTGTKSADQLRAERAQFKTTSEYNAAAAAEKAAARQAAKDSTASKEPAAGRAASGTSAERGPGSHRDQGRTASDQQRENTSARETSSTGTNEKTTAPRDSSLKPRAESPAADALASRTEPPRSADGTPRPGSDQHPGPPAHHEGVSAAGQAGENTRAPGKPRPAHDAGLTFGSGESATRRHRDDGLPPEGTLGPHLSWITLPPEARTLGDTTPTGIGLKPDGDQLLDKGSDKSKSPMDKLLDRAFQDLDDIRDSVGEIAPDR